MNLRPKTRRRLIILLAGGAAFLITAGTVITIQLRVYEAGRLKHRQAAMDAFHHGDYRTAAANFGQYLGNDRMDPEAIYDYAITRTKLPRPDMGHLLDACDLFKRVLELKPGDLDTQHQLLDIYQKLRYPAEIMTVADTLLEKNPDDVPALSAKLQLLCADYKFPEALPLSMRLNELNPLDIRTQITTCELLTDLRRPPAEIIARADRLLAAHPNDPRFQLLRGAAAYCTHDPDGTTKWFRTAAAGTPPDADFILLMAGVFDRMGMWADSQALLEKADVPTAPNEIKAALAQRLFEFGKYDRATAVLQGVNPADPAADSRLLGLLGLIQFTRDHTPQDSIIAALGARSDDLIAVAWCSLLKAVAAAPPADPLEPVRQCLTAERLDRDNADVKFYLAEQYLHLGESELALQCLREQTKLQPEWATPDVIIARILLSRGDPAAAPAAQAALDRDPQFLPVQMTAMLTEYAGLRPSATAADIKPVLTHLQKLRPFAPDDADLLAAEIDLLARSNQRSDAMNLALDAVKTQPGKSPLALLKLAAIDRADHLDLSSFITDRVLNCAAGTPDAALDEVRTCTSEGKAELARPLLATMASHPTIDWKLAWIQAREAMGDSDMTRAWETFADSEPGNLRVQQAAFQSPAVNADRGLMDRTIDRMKILTGEDALEWKMARASWQLSAPDDSKNNANAAAASMAEVVRVAPHYAPPQIIWADALFRLGDPSAAINHLRIAQSIEPENPAVSLKLAKVLIDQGQSPDALSLLNGIVSSASLSNSQRVETARLYRQSGSPDAGIRLLQDDQPIHPDDPPRDLLLAEMFAQRGDRAAAADIYDALMKESPTTADAARSAAWFYASQNQTDSARKCLARLKELPLPAGEKELILGQFECSFGTGSAAAAQFQAAAKAAPKTTRPWLAAAGLDLRNRDFANAAKTVDQGLKNNPNDSNLKLMLAAIRTLANLKLDDSMQPLIDSLSDNPASDAGAAMLAAIADSQTAHESDDALSHRLAAVVALFPRYLPALAMLVHLDITAGEFDPAINAATRACELLPTDPQPANLLTSVQSAAHHWEPALTAATQWRSRVPDHPLAADLAIAAVELQLKHPDQAILRISPYVKDAVIAAGVDAEKPSPAVTIVEIYLKALCLKGETDQAWATAEPIAKRSPAWRGRWLQIAASPAADAAAGSAEIQQAETILSPTSINDQLSRGEAWLTLGSRFNDPSLLQKALSIVEPLIDAGSPPPDAWLMLGALRQDLNDLPEAQDAYTKAAQAAPDSAIAKNNLAMVMWLRNQDLHAARQYAQQAVTLSPATSEMHSTLGEIDEQLNDLEAAKQQFEFAVRLNPDNAEALIGLASAADRTAHAADVPNLLHRVDLIRAKSTAPLPAPVKTELERLRSVAKPHVS